jgi:hypothetical protein
MDEQLFFPERWKNSKRNTLKSEVEVLSSNNHVVESSSQWEWKDLEDRPLSISSPASTSSRIQQKFTFLLISSSYSQHKGVQATPILKAMN